MKRIRIGQLILVLALVYFLTYNTWFGWNKIPINDAEKLCDNIFKVVSYIGLGIYLLPIWELYETIVKDKLNSKTK